MGSCYDHFDEDGDRHGFTEAQHDGSLLHFDKKGNVSGWSMSSRAVGGSEFLREFQLGAILWGPFWGAIIGFVISFLPVIVLKLDFINVGAFSMASAFGGFEIGYLAAFLTSKYWPRRNHYPFGARFWVFGVIAYWVATPLITISTYPLAVAWFE